MWLILLGYNVIYFSAKIAGINNVRIYNIFKKKNLHLIHAAKKFTEKFLQIKDCPTETNFHIKKEKLSEIEGKYKDKFKIVIGAGSSGPTTRWGSKNFSDLIKLSLPILIGSISILSKFGFIFKASRDGISSLHGAHQVAQKLSNTKLPL